MRRYYLKISIASSVTIASINEAWDRVFELVMELPPCALIEVTGDGGDQVLSVAAAVAKGIYG
jgi:hypothetical protein